MGGRGGGEFSACSIFFSLPACAGIFFAAETLCMNFFSSPSSSLDFFLDIFPCMYCFCARNFAKLDCLLHVLYRNENSPSGYSRTQPGLQFSLQRSGHWNLPCSDSSLPGSSTVRIFSQKKSFFVNLLKFNYIIRSP